VFVITCIAGDFYVVGKIVVDRVVNETTAAKKLPYKPWHASHHLLARPGAIMRTRFDVTVPMSEVRRLEFVSGAGTMSPKFLPTGLPDRQMFRGVRQLTDQSAGILGRLTPIEYETIMTPQTAPAA
jgi:hypothetical protein